MLLLLPQPQQGVGGAPPDSASGFRLRTMPKLRPQKIPHLLPAAHTHPSVPMLPVLPTPHPPTAAKHSSSAQHERIVIGARDRVQTCSQPGRIEVARKTQFFFPFLRREIMLSCSLVTCRWITSTWLICNPFASPSADAGDRAVRVIRERTGSLTSARFFSLRINVQEARQERLARSLLGNSPWC